MASTTLPMMASFPDNCLPPEALYNSREALFRAINDWAKDKGYAFSTGKSKTTESGRRIVTYACDRCGAPPSPLRNRQRKTSTRATNCLFSVLAKESLDHTTWAVHYRPDPRFSVHNHEPSVSALAHPIHRQLSSKDQSQLTRLLNASIAPRNIRTLIRETNPLAI